MIYTAAELQTGRLPERASLCRVLSAEHQLTARCLLLMLHIAISKRTSCERVSEVV